MKGRCKKKKVYNYTGEGTEPTTLKKETTYAYDSMWKDKMVQCDGKTLTYDEIGSLLARQKSDNLDMRFTYNTIGIPVALWYNGSEYYYVRNLQNDIIGLIDSTGEWVVEYSYDAWGKILNISGSLAATVGQNNPLRYRGYYYDNETGLYCVSNRYYHPEIGRFISCDSMDVLTIAPMSLANKNLYAYCDNNPIIREDKSGYFWNFVWGAVIGAASVYVGDVIENVIEGEQGWDILKPKSSMGTYLGAAASGMIPGSGVASIIARPIVSTGVKYGIDNGIEKQAFDIQYIVSDLALNVAGELLAISVNKVMNASRPQNYSSFRNQMTRRVPKITQKQTKQLMYAVNRGISVGIKILEFIIGMATSR